MRRLFACKLCGFLSTLASEHELVDGVRYDHECAEKVKAEKAATKEGKS